MADTVASHVFPTDDGYYAVHLTNQCDGTGESDVQKVDVSGLKDKDNVAATHLVIDYIEWTISGFNYVVLNFDADTDDLATVLPAGAGVCDWRNLPAGRDAPDWPNIGGKIDPQSTGSVGDLLLSTDGAINGAAYNITIYARPKA
jgi:hypothetical protein|tara:strand:- start:1159 stop:1593 length:435 start_codon:yes stop_codon:yes gene_type:complete